MRLNWQGWGRTAHTCPAGGMYAVEWHRLSGETYYCLWGVRNEVRRVIIEIRVPDFMWQDTEPRFFDGRQDRESLFY